MLRKLCDSVEDFLGDVKVFGVVVTVPAAFSTAQRRATQKACELAGLRVLQILNEPTAAAMAYGLHKRMVEDQRVLVVDYGGGTIDASLLIVEDGILEVRAVAGDTHWGGEDIDDRLVSYLSEEFLHNTGQGNPLEFSCFGRLITRSRYPR